MIQYDIIQYDIFSLCYVRDLVCVMCGIQSVLCAVFGLCYVKSLVRVMCSLQSVLCAVFSLCYIQSLVCVICSLQSVLYAVFSLCYVQSLVCVMYSLQSVLCAVFSLCYVQFTVMSLVASLRACLASLAWLASLAFGSSTHARYLLCCEPRHTCHLLYIDVYVYMGAIQVCINGLYFCICMYVLHIYIYMRMRHVYIYIHIITGKALLREFY